MNNITKQIDEVIAKLVTARITGRSVHRAGIVLTPSAHSAYLSEQLRTSRGTTTLHDAMDYATYRGVRIMVVGDDSLPAVGVYMPAEGL